TVGSSAANMLRVVALASFLVVVAGVSYLERRPELGVFQDEEKCFPYTGTWHAKYRNFEHDKYFGATTKCVRVSHKETFKNGSTVHRVEVGSTVKVVIKIKLVSSEGYTHKNTLHVSLKDLEEVSVDVSAAYIDCNVCKVLRHTYISKTACSVLLPATQLHQPNTVCDFVYDLLCGTEKYQIYDDSCKTQN
ncbi:conserved hypothetical protein, partial [Ixodes scapularis]